MFIIPKKASGKKLANQRYWLGVAVGIAATIPFFYLLLQS